jgi:lipopolysaccharide/colanic/teichoic acid biosynthesis glycosyltransferase
VGVALGSGAPPSSESLSAAWQAASLDFRLAEVQDPWYFRALQVSLAAATLLALSPILIAVAIAVRLLSPGPIFYRGQRVGQGMREFTIYKFRTLSTGAEAKIGARLLAPNDEFYTPIGKFLKRSKLDELPQLWNVITGHMNLVGPRPVRPIFLPEFLQGIPGYARRFQLRPGITGLAQLRGGYFTSPASKLRYEMWYLRQRGPVMDFQIIALTLLKILNRWITLGGLLLVLFVFVSFLPANMLSGVYLYAFGVRANVAHLAIAGVGLWLVLRRQRRAGNRITVYRTPLALPMAAFLVLSLISAVLSDHPYQALRGALYYLATGFLITSAIVNGTLRRGFVERALQVVALSAVVISLIGIVELVLAVGVGADSLVSGWLRGPGISATLGSPVVLATYLVLGVPALLYQLAISEGGTKRDFWMAATTLTFIGILLTKSSAGLVGVSVSTLLVVWRFFPQAIVPCGIVLGPFIYLAVARSLVAWPQAMCGPGNGLCSMVGGGSMSDLLFGVGPRTLGEYGYPGSLLEPEAVSAHVRLLVENGILGWLAILWVLVTALVVLYRSHREVRDPKLQALLWAVFCSVTGFVVTLQGFSAFENLTLQVFFWGLLGIGIATAVRFGPRRRDYAIVLKLGH